MFSERKTFVLSPERPHAWSSQRRRRRRTPLRRQRSVTDQSPGRCTANSLDDAPLPALPTNPSLTVPPPAGVTASEPGTLSPKAASRRRHVGRGRHGPPTVRSRGRGPRTLGPALGFRSVLTPRLLLALPLPFDAKVPTRPDAPSTPARYPGNPPTPGPAVTPRDGSSGARTLRSLTPGTGTGVGAEQALSPQWRGRGSPAERTTFNPIS